MKKGLPFAAAFLAVVLAGPTISRASDHIDGLKTAIDNAADLTDLYTFTSPKDPSKLVLVMNSHGVAFSTTKFSNAVEYKFRIHPVADAKTLVPVGREQVITCSFSGGGLFDSNQRATCRIDTAQSPTTIAFDTRSNNFRAGGSTQQGDIKAFAGVRSDTWFLDLGKTLAVNNGLPTVGPGVNGLHGANVLSIVIELDKARFGSSLLAVTAQTVRK